MLRFRLYKEIAFLVGFLCVWLSHVIKVQVSCTNIGISLYTWIFPLYIYLMIRGFYNFYISILTTNQLLWNIVHVYSYCYNRDSRNYWTFCVLEFLFSSKFSLFFKSVSDFWAHGRFHTVRSTFGLTFFPILNIRMLRIFTFWLCPNAIFSMLRSKTKT